MQSALRNSPAVNTDFSGLDKLNRSVYNVYLLKFCQVNSTDLAGWRPAGNLTLLVGHWVGASKRNEYASLRTVFAV